MTVMDFVISDFDHLDPEWRKRFTAEEVNEFNAIIKCDGYKTIHAYQNCSTWITYIVDGGSAYVYLDNALADAAPHAGPLNRVVCGCGRTEFRAEGDIQ